MSHTVVIKTQVKDPVAVAAACHRLKLPTPTQGTTRLFGDSLTGLLIKLPGWEYPAVIDTATGTVRYDNFNGAWGEQKELDRFLQAYAVERARMEARRKGLSVSEHLLQDGSIKLQIMESA